MSAPHSPIMKGLSTQPPSTTKAPNNKNIDSREGSSSSGNPMVVAIAPPQPPPPTPHPQEQYYGTLGGGGYNHDGGGREDSHYPASPTMSERSSLMSMSTRRMKRRKANRDKMAKLAQRVIGYSASAFITIALTFSLSILPLARVGMILGTDTLSNASVGLFTLYIFAQYPLMGFGLALDTLCSQEFGRNRNSRVMGLILRRGILIGMVGVIPMSAFLYFVAPKGLAYLYGVEVSTEASKFLLLSPLYLIFFNFYTCLGKFCFNQLHPFLPMIAVAVGAMVVTPICSFILVPFGLMATMFGICVAWGVQCVVLVALMLRDPTLRHNVWIDCPWFKGGASGFAMPAIEIVFEGEEDDVNDAFTAPPRAPHVPSMVGCGIDVPPMSSVISEHANTECVKPSLQTYSNYQSTMSVDSMATSTYSQYYYNSNGPVIELDDDEDDEDERSLGLYVLNPIGMKEYIKLAIPSMVLVVGEASAFDLTVLMAAALGGSAGASWSALLSFTLWFVAVAGGISGAANALVGGALGRGDAKLASTYSKLVVFISFSMSVINSIIIIASFDWMLVAFGLAVPPEQAGPKHIPTLTEQICGLVKYMLPIYHIGESVQYALQGVFSGLGRSALGAKLLMSTLWIIGVPLSIYLGFYGFPEYAVSHPTGDLCLHDPDLPKSGCSREVGVVGIVLGLIVAMAVECPALLYALFTMNWKSVAKSASIQNAR